MHRNIGYVYIYCSSLGQVATLFFIFYAEFLWSSGVSSCCLFSYFVAFNIYMCVHYLAGRINRLISYRNT